MLGAMFALRVQRDWWSWANHPIVRALALSVMFHWLLFSTVELGYRMGWWRQSLFAALRPSASRPIDPRVRAAIEQRNQPAEVSMVFVEVDPSQATAQPPPQAKNYSNRNSQAANRETELDTQTPKITGTQDKVPKTITQPRPRPVEPEPAPVVESKTQPQPLQAQTQPSQPSNDKSESLPKPGDLALAKPTETGAAVERRVMANIPEALPPAPARPRRLPKFQSTGLAGEKMRQEGGVRRRADVEGLDVKASPFGSYDAAIIAAIQKHWYDLLDSREFAPVSGKVVLTFRLNSNGTVSQLSVSENEVGVILGLICEHAVIDPAPYGDWPPDLRRLVGGDYREVRFTFHYN